MKITLDSIIRQKKDLLSSRIDDELVMMSIQSGKYYGLNPVSSRIWELIKEEKPLSEICDQLTQEYNVDIETCRRDILVFAQKLAEVGLIDVSDR